MGKKKDEVQETVSCADCDKIVLKERAFTTNEARFECWDWGNRMLNSDEAHPLQVSFEHYCKECNPGYRTKIVLPDGDILYYTHGYHDVHGVRREGWYEVV